MFTSMIISLLLGMTSTLLVATLGTLANPPAFWEDIPKGLRGVDRLKALFPRNRKVKARKALPTQKGTLPFSEVEQNAVFIYENEEFLKSGGWAVSLDLPGRHIPLPDDVQVMAGTSKLLPKPS